MKRRYVAMPRTKVRSYYDDWGEWMPDPSSITVLEEEPEHRPTGILNSHGHEFVVLAEANNIGFFARIEDE